MVSILWGRILIQNAMQQTSVMYDFISNINSFSYALNNLSYGNNFDTIGCLEIWQTQELRDIANSFSSLWRSNSSNEAEISSELPFSLRTEMFGLSVFIQVAENVDRLQSMLSAKISVTFGF